LLLLLRLFGRTNHDISLDSSLPYFRL
jgi:hypothetical protein